MTSKNASYAYLFEAKGIQRYILDSGPLRDLVGASDLVAGLARSDGATSPDPDLLQQVLDALELTGADVRLSRRAGGAFMAHAANRETLERLRGLWRLTASLRCPGLEMSDVLLTTEQAEIALASAHGVLNRADMKAMTLAYESGSTIRFNTAAELPPTGHAFTAFNPRTGRLITRLQPFRDSKAPGGGDLIPLDVVTETQRVRAEQLQGRLDGVAAKFLPRTVTIDADHRPVDGAGRRYAFPRNLDPREGDTFDNPLFPFRRRGGRGDVDRRVAVVHADLSGLAQAFRRIADSATAPEAVFAAATSIEVMVTDAVRAATDRWLLPNAFEIDGRKDALGVSDKTPQAVLPARPIVLGGDDITVIVRADLALPFTQTLLDEIETLSGKMAGPGKLLDKRLSACAGIALVKAGQPFLMASDLAESLCRHAKKVAKAGQHPPYPSFLAFQNAQSTLWESYDEVLKRELTTPHTRIRLTANPYPLRPSADTPTLTALMSLARALDRVQGLGKLIGAARLLFDETDLVKAGGEWVRWRKVQTGVDPNALTKVDEALIGAGFTLHKDEAAGGDWPVVAGMICDALDWLDFGLVKCLEADDERLRADAVSSGIAA